ncbi:MAG: flagellar motor protein MotB [Cellulomonas sp.]|nr:flagellar motor protein MotB [Cellulomonas sp.]
MSGHGGRGRSRRGGHEEEEHENSERWLISYSDLITVLLALFIVMYAISQVDQQKFIALSSSLSAGFNEGSTQMSVLDGTTGTQDGITPQTDTSISEDTSRLVTGDLGLGEQAANPTPVANAASDPTVAAAEAELAHLEDVKAAMAAALAAQGLSDQVTFRITSRGLVAGLVANDVFFAPESATLTDAAGRVLDSLAPTLNGLGEDLSIEGHANTLPTSGQYDSNWELSADRATKVLRHLVEVNGVLGTRIEAVGFGDTRPLVSGTDDAAMAANRRVDLVVLSAAPDNVRALLPTLAGQ